ncbi:DUF2461 domain-containing protein [Phyllobacterium pellucidum]|uniref:DUF2461 domain-containing protein n=1 Tax=Phyllobacterium pellucidum TaxID=2740464 RepID=UPI001D134A2C|nr:TIGR02453 family protein [Phyllobacterium sp. T1018]UGY09219.1 TIGR02453 family protein [Phyllobacterium sp. T1018]
MSEPLFKGFGDKALPFLKALDFHQNREWFLENKELFEAHLYEPLGDLVEDLIARFEKAGLPFKGDRKKSQFRIKRDTRFAKDKSPYNRHLSALLSPDGSKWTETGCFYVCVGLEDYRGCYAAVAWWQPKGELLTAMRKSIVTKPEKYRAMVEALRKNGLELRDSDRLKRTPRGFDDVTDADLIEALRNRNFVVRHAIDPGAITAPELADDLFDFALRSRPLIDWGRSIEGTLVTEVATL